jgi:nitrogen regulatory protein P-II 1
VDGVSVVEVHDHAPQKHERTVWLGHEYSLGFSVKIRLDIVVHDDQVDEVVGAIIKAARTGHHGDGHVMVLPLEHRYNIRDGNRDVSEGTPLNGGGVNGQMDSRRLRKCHCLT